MIQVPEKLSSSLEALEAALSRIERRMDGAMSLSPAFTVRTLWLALGVFVLSLCINVAGIYLQ